MTSAPAPAAAAPLPVRTGRPRPGPATRQTSLILGPLATAPGTARGTLHTALILWGLTRLSDDAEAVTSELVTNAITASRAAAPPGTEPRPVTLWISARDQELCIRVWDPCPTPPPLHQPPPDPLTEHGRGLLIVTALSHQWGTHPAPNGGKYVWATLKAAPAASSDPAARFTPLAPAWPETSPSSRVRPHGTTHPARPCPPAKRAPAMFNSLTDETLRAAHDAARLLYDNHRALGLDPTAIKLDTLRVDIAAELENRGKPATPGMPGTVP